MNSKQGKALIRIKPVCLECLSTNCYHLAKRSRILAPREVKILYLLRQGIIEGPFPSDKQLAEQMQLKVGTLKTYMARLYVKLGTHGRSNVAVWAKNNPGIFSLDEETNV